ncbi:hypothetical protein [Flavobacterium columnare]|uniref:hypothetical protein n=1 Tax=Flavobacterium columnare TaxID=996 RepID=UPI000D1AA9C7|nr:hypothetical protein [Flavobacterium columnare]PTD14369.1 hypothetical protein C6N29_07930 [Flavobacterium columnare]
MSKITVKHFLNTRLKPEIENNVEKYPVFCMILFNRHTIIKKSITFLKLSKEEFENKKFSGKFKKQIELSLNYELGLIYRIVKIFAFDKDKNKISNNFLNFDSRFSYKSKNKELNQLNSYLNYYVSNVNEAISNFIYKENVIIEFKSKIDSVFNFENNNDIKESIIEVFGNAEIFASDWDSESKMLFLKNNISSEKLELVFLDYCFEEFETYLENKKTGYWCIPLFEWLFNFNEISKSYEQFILKDEKIKEFSEKMDIKITSSIIKNQLKIIKNITFDNEFHLKYRC